MGTSSSVWTIWCSSFRAIPTFVDELAMTHKSNTALRKAMTALRAGTHLKITTFGRVAGLNQQTVRRVEDVKGLPDYSPSYEVVSKWLIACKHPSSAEEFLLQHGGMASRATGASRPLGPAVSLDSIIATADPALLERIAFTLIRAAATRRSRA